MKKLRKKKSKDALANPKRKRKRPKPLERKLRALFRGCDLRDDIPELRGQKAKPAPY